MCRGENTVVQRMWLEGGIPTSGGLLMGGGEGDGYLVTLSKCKLIRFYLMSAGQPKSSTWLG